MNRLLKVTKLHGYDIFIAFVVVITSAVTLVNLADSYAKSRDLQRKNDLGSVMKMLEDFKDDIGYYPASNDKGQIIGCDGVMSLTKEWFFKPCQWNDNPINSPYFNKLPIEPKSREGGGYLYISNGKHYQLFAKLERDRDKENRSEITARKLKCGDFVCSIGRTDLDINTLFQSLPED